VWKKKNNSADVQRNKKKKYRLYLHRGKVALVAMCLWRVLVAGPIFAAVLAHVSTVVTAPAPAA
jgi:hypothetical protein